jgi:hypothetical protein
VTTHLELAGDGDAGLARRAADGDDQLGRALVGRALALAQQLVELTRRTSGEVTRVACVNREIGHEE